MEGRRFNPYAIASVSVLAVALFFSGFAVGVVRGATSQPPDGNPVGFDMPSSTTMLRGASRTGRGLCVSGCNVRITFKDKSNTSGWPSRSRLQCGNAANCLALTATQLETVTANGPSWAYHPAQGQYSVMQVSGELKFDRNPCT